MPCKILQVLTDSDQVYLTVPWLDPVVTTSLLLERRPAREEARLVLLLGSPGSIIGKWK